MQIYAYVIDMWGLATQGDKQGILFFIALYMLVMLGYSLVYQLRVRAWTRTRGELVQAEVTQFGLTETIKHRQNYALRGRYRYRVNGVEYEGHRVSPWVLLATHNLTALLRRQLGGIECDSIGGVTVFYNPANPKRSYLRRPGWFGILLTLALAMLPLLLYFRAYPL